MSHPEPGGGGRRVDLEAELTFATALLAGALYLYYLLANFTSNPGWDGVLSYLVACYAMAALMLLVLGMAVTIVYRGHWMALALVEDYKDRRKGDGAGEEGPREEEREGDEHAPGGGAPASRTLRSRLAALLAVDVLTPADEGRRVGSDLERLDAGAVTAFNLTFQFFHGLFLGFLILVAFRLSQAHAPLVAYGGMAVLVFLLAGPVLGLAARVLFFMPVVARAASGFGELRNRLGRSVGIPLLPREFWRRRQDRVRRVALGLVFAAIYVVVMLATSMPVLGSDAPVYLPGRDERVLVTFVSGGIQTDYYEDTVFDTQVSGLLPGAPEPRWYPAANNTYVCSIKVADLLPGPQEIRLVFHGYTVNDPGRKTSRVVMVSTRFVVLE